MHPEGVWLVLARSSESNSHDTRRPSGPCPHRARGKRRGARYLPWLGLERTSNLWGMAPDEKVPVSHHTPLKTMQQFVPPNPKAFDRTN